MRVHDPVSSDFSRHNQGTPRGAWRFLQELRMKTTREVAEELELSPAALRQHIAAGHIARPKRRAGLLFLWTPDEVAAAQAALSKPGRRRPRYVVDALAEGASDD